MRGLDAALGRRHDPRALRRFPSKAAPSAGSPSPRWTAARRRGLRRDHPVYDRTTGQEVLPRLRRDAPSIPSRSRLHPDWDGLATRDLHARPAWRFSPDGRPSRPAPHGSGSTGDAWVAGVYLWDVGTGREAAPHPCAHGLELLGELLPRRPDARHDGHRDGRPPLGRGQRPRGAPPVGAPLVDQHPGRLAGRWDDLHDGPGRRPIRDWDPATGRERGVFAQFSASINGMVIADDGKTLLMGERFGAVTLWDVAGRREIRRFARNQPGHGVWHVAFAPDGRGRRRLEGLERGLRPRSARSRTANPRRSTCDSPRCSSHPTAGSSPRSPREFASGTSATGQEVRWAVRSNVTLPA